MTKKIEYCRICLDNQCSPTNDFISPCKCSGTLKYVHRNCFDRWSRERSRYDQQFRCEICNTLYHDEQRVSGFRSYLAECFDMREANRTSVIILLTIIPIYVTYYLLFSGPLHIMVHSGEVPDMDILLWEKSDAYAAICVDMDCQCITEVHNDNNEPIWKHKCEYWQDKSIFFFSKITFSVFDADIGKNDDFIGEVSVPIYQVLLKRKNEKMFRLKWDIPYKGSILVKIQWTSNIVWLFQQLT